MTAGLSCSGERWLAGGRRGVSDGGGCWVPFPLRCRGSGRTRSVCWQSSPGCGGWPGGDSRAAANFRRWAEPQGKQPAGGRCRTRTAVPTSIASEHRAIVALKMLPWAGTGALL